MTVKTDEYRDYAEVCRVLPELQTPQAPLIILPSMAGIDIGQHEIDKEYRVDLLR